MTRVPLAVALGIFLASPGEAAPPLPWRVEAPVPNEVKAECPRDFKRLESYFWDYLENLEHGALDEERWSRLNTGQRLDAVREHCDTARQVHEIFVTVMVDYDHALQQAQRKEMSRKDRQVLIDKTLNQHSGSLGMVEEKLGFTSDAVTALNKKKVALIAERNNLAVMRGEEKLADMQARGSLQGARAIADRGAGADNREALDILYLNEGAALPLPRAGGGTGERPAAKAAEESAGGTLVVKRSNLSADRDVPATDPSLKRLGDNIKNDFDRPFMDKVRTLWKGDENPRPRQEEPPIEGYTRGESKFIQDGRDAWPWGMKWIGERRAKIAVESVRNSMKECARRPEYCRKLEDECRRDPSLQGSGSCLTFENKKVILGR